MNKIVIMFGGSAYVFGYGSYVIAYAVKYWRGDMSYLVYKTMEGVGKGYAWPLMAYEWFMHGTPMM